MKSIQRNMVVGIGWIFQEKLGSIGVRKMMCYLFHLKNQLKMTYQDLESIEKVFVFDELERRNIDYDQIYLVDGMNMIK